VLIQKNPAKKLPALLASPPSPGRSSSLHFYSAGLGTVISGLLMKTDHGTNGQIIEIHIQDAVAVEINFAIIRCGDCPIILHGEELTDPASGHLLMRLDLALSFAGVFIELTFDGVKGIANGYMNVLMLFMLGRWFAVDDKLSFRRGNINPGLEQAALLMALGWSLNDNVAADDIPMVAGHFVDPFSNIRFYVLGCFHITKGDL
jgi:hypothetical protein